MKLKSSAYQKFLSAHVKRQIIEEEIALPDVPNHVLEKYPSIVEGIKALEEQGFPVLVKDASLGGQFPVILAVTESENFVEHFIDSTGVISWRFFSAKSDYEFSEWDFTGTNEEECAQLFSILKDLGKEAYVAVFDDIGDANSYSACRILVPDYSEVISFWGQLTILELKILTNLALGELDIAIELVEEFLQFNDNTVERGLFYQAIHTVLEIALDEEMEIEDYIDNLNRMFGKETYD
ncbi:Ribosomal protein S12 methylthiotransferase accessory factor YcaO [Nymphon striatum]|nr:Ribosomal protein S12 methylthiotransferase accessory factor YcaO [Nymphon striatum]